MDTRIIVLRTVVRAVLAGGMLAGLVTALWFLLTELNDPNPNAALTALLGSITAAIGQSLVSLVAAISANPSDRQIPE